MTLTISKCWQAGGGTGEGGAGLREEEEAERVEKYLALQV
jgi:hypothetical protein